MSELLEKCTLAKDAGYKMVSVSTVTKDNTLEAIANALVERADEIIAANNIDIENAKKNGTRQAMIDKLTLTKERIDGIAEGVRQVKALADPIGEVIKMWKRPNGLTIGQKRVPMGVIAIIYEARPNVTVDAAVLCLKTSNACILRGGSEAINSNKAVMKIMQDAAYGVGIPEGTLNIIEDTSRETATQLMKMNGYVDLLRDLFVRLLKMRLFPLLKRRLVTVTFMLTRTRILIWRLKLCLMRKYNVRLCAMPPKLCL